jgi:hypothetical protein
MADVIRPDSPRPGILINIYVSLTIWYIALDIGKF